MAKQVAVYKVLGDGTGQGIQIAGAGAFTKDSSSIFMPGQILRTRADFRPRACMDPQNGVAKAAFAAERKRIEAVWRESLAKGENPDGQALQNVELPLSKEQIEVRVKKEIEKVGPRKSEAAHSKIRGRGKRLAPGTLMAVAPEPVPEGDDLADALDADDEAAGRASDSE